LSDWWEAFVISGCYGMGDPLARTSRMRRESQPYSFVPDAAAPMKIKARCEDREQRRGEASPP
jgi:hypothetical protein